MKDWMDSIEEMHNELQDLKEKCDRELAACPKGRLHCVHRTTGRHNYYHVYEQDGKTFRKGITKNRSLLRDLARKEYLIQLMSPLHQDISLLAKTRDRYQSLLPKDILAKLPRAYKTLPESFFFPAPSSRGQDDPAKWAAEPFRQNASRPEEKGHITSKGLRVRSKSELLIAEKLYAFNVPFRYEQILQIGERLFAPDFTIKGPAGLIYWEHAGKVNDPDYMGRHRWKISRYEGVGIVPWKNLIVTYDDEKGNLNLNIIESEIRNKLL